MTFLWEGRPSVDQKAVHRMIAELRREQMEIRTAIRALEFLATGKRPRGRPPKRLAEATKPERRGKVYRKREGPPMA